MLARQAPLELHATLLFVCFSYFSGRVSVFCLGLSSAGEPPTYGLLNSWYNRFIG
jgi:hypothetical protein